MSIVLAAFNCSDFVPEGNPFGAVPVATSLHEDRLQYEQAAMN